MKLFHSNKTYVELLQDMQKDGYSQNYMKCVNREIRWLENHQGVYYFDSFEAACQIRVAQTSSPETQAIRSVLSGNKGGLCLRNHAIGAVLYFTGMRSSDVAGLKFSDIDWGKEEIRIIQKKTGEELLLPLTTAVGNAIFDYAAQERPDSADEHIFLCGTKPYRPISPGTVGNAAQKIYEAAAIRQNKGDRKGAFPVRCSLRSGRRFG